MITRLMSFVLMCMLLQGCIAVPIPHKETVIPSFSGKVIDRQNKRPIADAKVEIAHFPDTRVCSQTDGQFTTKTIQQFHWFLLVPLLPSDRFWNGELTLAHDRYETHRQNIGALAPGGRFRRENRIPSVIEMIQKPNNSQATSKPAPQ